MVLWFCEATLTFALVVECLGFAVLAFRSFR
jgi:hypothetical protein